MWFLEVIFERALRSDLDCRIKTFEPAFGVGLNCIKRNVLILLGMAAVFLAVKVGPIGLQDMLDSMLKSFYKLQAIALEMHRPKAEFTLDLRKGFKGKRMCLKVPPVSYVAPN